VCALFHDVTDGEALGRLIATQLLAHFLDEYSAGVCMCVCLFCACVCGCK
jgi:hypothetical protein